MNTSSRRSLPVALALVIGLALASCGSETSDPDPDPDTGTAIGNGSDGDGDGNGAGETQPAGTDSVIADLRIIVSHPDRETDLEYTVGCLGDTFPVTPEVDGVDGQTGCDKLADDELRSRLIDGPAADRVCTEQYGGPDEAVITGTIDGEAVDATITRANGCEIATWDALVGLLPPPIGVTD